MIMHIYMGDNILIFFFMVLGDVNPCWTRQTKSVLGLTLCNTIFQSNYRAV